MDVLWFRLPRQPEDLDSTFGRIDTGRIFISINRGEHWQCGYVIRKGELDEIRRRGLPALRDDVANFVPLLGDRGGALRSWDDVKLLTVRVDRLACWYRPGLLCIGDAAHAMWPIGGVGINLAIHDAVAAANLLAGPLGEGTLATNDLRRFQRRRELPVRITQRLQLLIQGRVITAVLDGRRPLGPPIVARRAPARAVPPRPGHGRGGSQGRHADRSLI